jgi:hypothetical protein
MARIPVRASTATHTPRRSGASAEQPRAEAVEALAGSKLAVDAFGEDVHAHLLNTARQELAAASTAR